MDDVYKAAVISIAMGAQPLSALGNWPPVESVLFAVLGALEGEGMTEAELRRCMRWSRSWGRLSGRLRVFYAGVTEQLDHMSEIETKVVNRALWRILEPNNNDRALDDFEYGKLTAIWKDMYGREPELELVPRKH